MVHGASITSVADIDWEGVRGDEPCHPSPDAWEDQSLYFLIVDRFSDGNERGFRDLNGDVVEGGGTPPLRRGKDEDAAVESPEDARRWRKAGATWCGGNLRGLTTKLGYLKRLGVTALWVSPLLKQAPWSPDDYHGYGTQNFLEVDPHFGTNDDLKALTATAHSLGMYVVLDIILNHTADVFAYEGHEEPNQLPPPYRAAPEPPYPVAGFRDASGKPTLPFGALGGGGDGEADTDAGVWPRELQDPGCFSRRGRIEDWESYPDYEEGDFFTLKDLYLGCCGEDAEEFHPSPALRALTEVYKYWISYADLDGFRIDTVKHMPLGAVAWFAREIHGFAESIGKRNFLLVGEIVGDRARAAGTLIQTGLNAALGTGELAEKIRDVAAFGAAPASEYFDVFANSRREGEADPDPVWWRDRVVTFFDDHDQVGQDPKGRLASAFGGDRVRADRAVLRAAAFQATTLGVPCLYYGSEQALDGHAPAPGDEPVPEGAPSPDDQTIRECLFGGPFGPFRTTNRHAFDEDGWLYRQIARLLTLRRENTALRRGRQYLRPVSADGGESFFTPGPGEGGEPYRGVVAWSRLLDVDELVCALSTDDEAAREVLVTADDARHGEGSAPLVCLYSTDPGQVGQEVSPVRTAEGWAVPVTVPQGGFVLYR